MQQHAPVECRGTPPILKYTWIDFVSDFPSGQEKRDPDDGASPRANKKFFCRRAVSVHLPFVPREDVRSAKGGCPRASRYVIRVSGERSEKYSTGYRNLLNCKLHYRATSATIVRFHMREQMGWRVLGRRV